MYAPPGGTYANYFLKLLFISQLKDILVLTSTRLQMRVTEVDYC